MILSKKLFYVEITPKLKSFNFKKIMVNFVKWATS